MAKTHFIVVCYDIPNDRRRTRLHTKLKDYGTPVQYSLFECLVSEQELQRMQRAVQRIIKPRLDHVRYYHLCGNCQTRIETTQAGVEVAHSPAALIV